MVLTARYLFTRASGFLPVAMSVAALGVVALGLLSGTTRQPDEGALARIWQILIAGQLPIVAWFALRWVPPAPRPALLVLGAQLTAGLVALAPVFLLRL